MAEIGRGNKFVKDFQEMNLLGSMAKYDQGNIIDEIKKNIFKEND